MSNFFHAFISHRQAPKWVTAILILCLFFSTVQPQAVLADSYTDDFETEPFTAPPYPTSFTTGTSTTGLSYVCNNCNFDWDGSTIQAVHVVDDSVSTITIVSRDAGAFQFSSIYVEPYEPITLSGTLSGVEEFSTTFSSTGTQNINEIVDTVVITSSASYDMDIYFDDVTIDTSPAPAPEIALQRASTSIADGGQDNLGTRALGSQSLTYTVDNTAGAGDLEISSISESNLSNVNSFSLNTSTPFTVTAGNTDTFNITFNVVANGSFSLDLDIANNDSDENPYDIQLVGTGDATPPELSSFTRQTPASSPTNADSLVFRATFDEDVQNVGVGDFSVNSTSTATVTGVSSVSASVYDVTVSGGNLAGFNGTVGLNLSGSQDITDLVGNALPAGEPSTDETYTVDNDAPGLTSFVRQTPATSSTNADSLVFRATFDEDVQNVGVGDFSVNSTSTANVTGVSPVSASVYDVTVSGGDLAGFNGTVGVNLSGSQDITDLSGNTLPAGEPSTDETYTLDNNAPELTSFARQTPASSPTNADSLVFRATFDEDVQNVGVGDFSVNSTSTATVTGVSSVSATVYDITVSGGDLAGFNGTVGVNLSGSQDITDLIGNALPAGEPSTDETYTLDNDAPGLTSFSRLTPASSPTNADSLIFQATFDEDVQNVGVGDFSVNSTSTATVTGVSPVSASVYDVTVSGGDLAGFNGTVGLNLSGSQDITDLVGIALPAGEPSTDETYTLDNIGPSVTIDQASGQADPTTNTPINFTVIFDQSVSDFATGDVTLSGTGGATTANVTGSGTTYNVAVSGMTSDGTVIAQLLSAVATDALGNPSSASTSTDNQVTYEMEPEIDIQRPPSTSIADGGTDTLGTIPIGTNTFTYTVDNTAGIDILSITNVTATNLSNATGFTLNTATPINIAAGGTGSFEVQFNIPAEGAFSLDMDVANNDPDEANYDIAITGTGYSEPEIAVSYNSTNISDGDSTPSTADGTDFGQDLINYLPYSPEHTFTITNSGVGTLILTDTPRVNLTGTDFSLVTDAPTSIAPGAEATFVVRFAATSTGAGNGSISIDNNDTDENPFNFNITGTGYSGPLMAVQGGSPAQTIENGDTTPNSTDDTEFGASNVSGGTVDHTFTIQNYGDGALALGGSPIVSISGSNASDFSVTSQPGTPISAGSSDTFTIQFDPSAVGNRTATVSIQNDDPNRDPYTFTIQGQGDEFLVMESGNTDPTDGETLNGAPSNLRVQFTREALADGTANAANFINNYLLIEAGVNASFDTISCAGGVITDDTQINISGVTYNSLAHTATLSVNSADFTTDGQYRLLICGTTSIYDIYGNELNGGTSDTIVNFTVAPASSTDATTALLLPATGFPINEDIVLPAQSIKKQYKNANMLLEIPALNIELPIVGVPLIDGEWDVSWLTSEAGYLDGTAYPTWKGNTVITGHVWDAFNEPGPFNNLKNLLFGDIIKIQSGKSTYIYEVRDTRLHKANGIHSVITHEEIDWLTLVTCEGYQENNQTYAYRRIVRAVLIEVIPE